MRRNTFVRLDNNPSKRLASSDSKPYTPYMPNDMMEALQRRGTIRNDVPDSTVQHWSEYGPSEIQNMYIAMGLGNPPNMSWIQPATDVVQSTLKADRARAHAAVEQKQYVMRSIQPLAPPDQPPVTSPLDQSLYPFPQLSEATNRRNHSAAMQPQPPQQQQQQARRYETLVDETEATSASSVFVISKDDLIKFLAVLCALMLGFILYLVSRK